MYDLNMIVPDLTSGTYTADNKFRLLKNYLYELNDALSYALGDRLSGDISTVRARVDSGEKSNQTRVQQLSAQSVKRFNELKEQIIRTAEDIEREYRAYTDTSKNEIIQGVESTYVAKSEFGEYKNEAQTKFTQSDTAIKLVSENVDEVSDSVSAMRDSMRSEISVQSDSIISMVGEQYATKGETAELESRVSSQVLQTSKDITESFSRGISEISEDISTVGGAFAQLVSDLEVYIRRGELEENVFGIEIGRSDSGIKARFTNDRLSFYQGITEVAYVSGSSLYITNAHILDYLKVGNSSDGFFMLDVTGNGLEVRWINGN